jgi:formylmethanofuran dehydrogenase subunit E
MDNTPQAFVARVAEATARREGQLSRNCAACGEDQGFKARALVDGCWLCALCADDAKVSA